MHGFLMRALHWFIALLGLWEAGDILLPFVAGVGHVQTSVWNHIIVGIILMIVGVWAGLTSDTGAARATDGIAAAAGLWLILASFVLGSPLAVPGLWNDVAVGVVVLILSLASGLLLQRRR